MRAEIITIGEEILIGQVADTNSAWMAALLNQNGIMVQRFTTVSDKDGDITEALQGAAGRADIILLTGGLGPTRDDITKNTLARYFGTKLRFDESVMQDIENYLKLYNRPINGLNRTQAEVPENCTVLHNKLGTAPGMWFDINGKVFVSLPGVPYEMKALMSDEVLPRLKQKFSLPFIYNKTVLTIGIAESALAEKIVSWEDTLQKDNISLAYLPSAEMVRLRLSSSGTDYNTLKEKTGCKVDELIALAGKYIYGYDNDTLEEIIGKLLIQNGETLSTAESCTGGYLAHRITSVNGSSAYFKGSVVAYTVETKVNLLGVKPENIERYGVVSANVAEEMAERVRKLQKTDYAIATTGFAGPGGGTAEYPVGTVWIAVASKMQVQSLRFLFPNRRERNIHAAAIRAMTMLRLAMNKHSA
ncbi:MAG: competence/damage-inducible protein A [Bacteroidia bacterium]|nr:competence/damage-inducible protein A [Bacteroidia bacterium]